MQGHVGFEREEVVELKKLLQNEIYLRKAAEEEIGNLKGQLLQFTKSEVLNLFVFIIKWFL